MSDPKIAGTRPEVLDLEPGTYWWCACGESKNQPWCDGAHKGGEFSPVKVEIEEAGRKALCTCKRSAKQPLCDGAHKDLG